MFSLNDLINFLDTFLTADPIRDNPVKHVERVVEHEVGVFRLVIVDTENDVVRSLVQLISQLLLLPNIQPLITLLHVKSLQILNMSVSYFEQSVFPH